MAAWLVAFAHYITDGFQYLIHALTDGLVAILKEYCLYYLKISEVFFYIKLRVGLEVAIELIDVYLAPLDLKSPIYSAWSAIPGELRSMLCFFRIPDAVSILLSAYAMRLVRMFIPFLS